MCCVKKMDAELLKCGRTHDAISRCLPLSRSLLHLMCYLTNVGCKDQDFIDFKNRLSRKLCLLLTKPMPDVNIARFGLDSCNIALYYQCVRDNNKPPLVTALRDLIEAWKRMVLGLDDAEKYLNDIYKGFCELMSYISYPKKEMRDLLQTSGFVCPLCMLTDVCSDIGWTDYVCPKPTADDTEAISKRGVDPNLPAGGCEHLLSVKSTKYDKLLLC